MFQFARASRPASCVDWASRMAHTWTIPIATLTSTLLSRSQRAHHRVSTHFPARRHLLCRRCCYPRLHQVKEAAQQEPENRMHVHQLNEYETQSTKSTITAPLLRIHCPNSPTPCSKWIQTWTISSSVSSSSELKCSGSFRKSMANGVTVPFPTPSVL